MTEEWRVCIEDSKYEVSSLGRVRSKEGSRYSKLLKPWKINSGYLVVCFCSNYIKTRYLVHRLVANAFCDGDKSLIVNHKDGNKLNNNKDNLEWCSQQINVIKSKSRTNKSGYKYIYLTSQERYVVRIIRNRKTCYTKTFKTLSEAISERDVYLEGEKFLMNNF